MTSFVHASLRANALRLRQRSSSPQSRSDMRVRAATTVSSSPFICLKKLSHVLIDLALQIGDFLRGAAIKLIINSYGDFFHLTAPFPSSFSTNHYSGQLMIW